MPGRADRGYDSAHPAVQALLNTPAPELTARRGELQAAAEAAGLSADDIKEVLNSRRELPRSLLAEERATLLAVLDYQDFDGHDELVAQVDAARVYGYCGCGCASVDLTVDGAAPSVPWINGPIPNQLTVTDAGGEPIGGVIVFVDGGYLSLLEIVWFEQPISPFPPLEQLQRARVPVEKEYARALAEAVAKYAAEGTKSSPLLGKVEGCLEDLLYRLGGDGVKGVSVEEFLPTRITIIGVSYFLDDAPWEGLFEATFQLDEPGCAVAALTIRVVDERRISRGEAPEWDGGYVESWRETLRIIASRPTTDEDWAHVLHYEFD